MYRHLPPVKTNKHEKAVVPKYPSDFGSHAKMVNEELTVELPEEEVGVFVVCTDDYGNYKTKKKCLDNGLSDPRRNVADRFAILFKKISANTKKE